MVEALGIGETMRLDCTLAPGQFVRRRTLHGRRARQGQSISVHLTVILRVANRSIIKKKTRENASLFLFAQTTG
jgi:hypothetical protein